MNKSNVPPKQINHCAVEDSDRDMKCRSDRPVCGQQCVREQRVLSAYDNTAVLSTTGSCVPASAAPPSDCSGGNVGLPAATDVLFSEPVIHECSAVPPTAAPSGELFGPDTQSDVINSEPAFIHNNAECIDTCIADGWSELRYVDVVIDGISGVIRALDDSGAQVCLVRALSLIHI